MIVFLGNAGPRYNGTRHNVGFAVGDILAKRCGVSINRLRSRALTARGSIGGHDVLLVKPQTFMNLSGEAVRPLADYFKIPPEHVLVVSDEVALVPGRLRLRASGSAGGAQRAQEHHPPSRHGKLSPGCASASAPRRTPITTWPTG